MDTHPRRPDDLSEVERRLAAWEPAADGLDADALLFAAGRASVRPGPARFLWPALTAGMAALAVVLGVWLAAERTERLDLARQLRQPAPAPAPSPAVSPPEPPSAEEERPPNSLFAARRALELGLDAWPPQAVSRARTPGPTPPDPPVLQVGWRDVLLDP